jgi:hypothetical protein
MPKAQERISIQERIFIQTLSRIDMAIKTVGLCYLCPKTKNAKKISRRRGQITPAGPEMCFSPG